jgi:outer membrane receptor for ferrienterochelin and colicin
MTRYIFLFIIALLSTADLCAEKIKGYVYDDEKAPIVGANVRWKESDQGTSTDPEGFFELECKAGDKTLIVSYIGFATTEIAVEHAHHASAEPLRIYMSGAVELGEVVISERKVGTISSRIDVLQTQKITYAELTRAACCSLAESFETNPSVDVSYADAATGARQIKLLGLSSTYVQMLTENYPNFRGAASLYGLDYIPGPWMESIQVSKGTSSVKNGYEALAGQINVEYKKPQTADIFSANVFASDAGRYEANSDASRHVNDNLATGLFLHYSNDSREHDDNGDGFLDIPFRRQVNLMNRWQHRVNNYVAQYGARYINESRTGGQAIGHGGMTMIDPYRINILTNRLEGFTKQAYIFDADKVESMALIASGSYHDQQSTYDRTPYNITQKNFYASLMYEKEFTKMHSLSSGLSLNYDGFDETLRTEDFNRSETVFGAYGQYTFTLSDKFIALAGLRADHSSRYGLFVTPRLHLKYTPATWFSARASVGKGYHTSNVLAENNFLLASSRAIVIADDLKQEDAWNTGVNLSFYIPVAGKDLTINAEWYYTDFLSQVVVDVNSDPHKVSFYNLGDGDKSYSHSYQVEATYPFLRGFTVTGAYRYTDARTDYRDAGTVRRLRKPLVSDYKALLTASYQSPLKKWQVDLTGQFNGGGRMPLPDQKTPMWDETFGAYQVWNGQLTRFFRTWSVYAGAENIFNFTQKNPIIDAANPRGGNFDGSMIWGPVHGQKFYVGLRFNIARLD